MSVINKVYNALYNKGRQVKQAYNNFKQTPLYELANDPEAQENILRMNADNKIGRALQNFNDAFNDWYNNETLTMKNNLLDRAMDAEKRYNKTLQEYGGYTYGWPDGFYGEGIDAGNWNAYQRYGKGSHRSPRDYGFGSEKGGGILAGEEIYSPYDVQGTVQNAVNLLTEMRDLSGYIQQLEEQQIKAYQAAGHDLYNEPLWEAYRASAQKTQDAKDLLRTKRTQYYRTIRGLPLEDEF